MKIPVYGPDGSQKGSVALEKAFSTPVRPDVITRAILSVQSRKRQPYGTDTLAGLRTSAHYHGERSIYMSMMNREMARLPRLHGNTGHLFFTARRVPQATKGREAHPPKPEKIYRRKINKKEFRLAFLSALAATSLPELVRGRGHIIDGAKSLPIVVSDEVENISKPKELIGMLVSMGLEKELERVSSKAIRASSAKRGRKHKRKKGILLVISRQEKLERAAGNIPGLEIATPKTIKIEQLAPGTHPGRLVVWSESAIKETEKFYFGGKAEKAEKASKAKQKEIKQ